MNKLTYDQVASAVSYDPATGDIRWLRPAGRFGRIPVGAIAGGLNNEGYRHIVIDGVKVAAHRVAYLLMTRNWPADCVDHINMDRADNRWANLRPADRSQNKANQRIRKDSRNQYKGVVRQKDGRYGAEIVRGGVKYWLGMHDTERAAAAAYATAAQTVFGQFARAA